MMRTLVAMMGIGLTSVGSLGADPVPVTGQIVFANRFVGQLDLVGPDFSWTAQLPTNQGPYLLGQCLTCLPDTVMRVGAEWSAGDLSASTVVYQGEAFSGRAWLASDGLASVDLLGEITIPALVGTLAHVSVPFSLAGFFITGTDYRAAVTNRHTFTGQGTATVTFQRSDQPYWMFGGATYALQDPMAAHAPELGTMTLVGTALAAGVWRRRHRRV